MGRRRRKDTHLPKRMYERRGKYYFDSPATKKWEPLGDDYALALAAYGRLAGPLWTGRVLHDVFTRYKTEITATIKDEEARTHELRTIDRFDKLFGHMHQDSLTQRHLYKYMDERLDERAEVKHLKRKAPSAARHDVRFLKKVLTKGIKWSAGTVNPVLALEFDPEPKNERDVTDEEFAAVYAMTNERMQVAMDLASNIGQRRGDLLKIRPADDFTDEGILIRQGKTKAAVLVEWTPTLRATVERAMAMKPDIPRDYLLRSRTGRPYSKNGFKSIWRKLIQRAVAKGVIAQSFKFHDLRGKAATDKAMLETDEDAQKLLGHADVKTTRRNYIRRKKAVRARPVR
jgi:integrase